MKIYCAGLQSTSAFEASQGQTFCSMPEAGTAKNTIEESVFTFARSTSISNFSVTEIELLAFGESGDTSVFSSPYVEDACAVNDYCERSGF